MTSLMEKMKKNSRIKEAAVLSESEFFNNTFTKISVPAINVALAGDLDKGLSSGLTVLAGPSKHFKTSFALVMAASYLDENPDAILLFYDTEFGSPQAYFGTFGIDMTRVFHTPVEDIEQLKFDLVGQLANLDREDKVIIVIDSIGNIASKKELEDAMNEKSVADMSRAKALKGLFRMVTPKLKMKDIPLLAINHVYQEMGMYPKAIVSGGTGIYYSADTIWIVGRQQEKLNNSKEVLGYHFVVRVEKSRFVKEGSKIPITVTWEQGIDKYSGLLDMAVAGGFVRSSVGWYELVDQETGEIIGNKMRAKDTQNDEFWEKIFNETKFKDFIRKQYSVGFDAPVDMDEIVLEET
jgi:RecA/RadA recombinase